jgi:NADH-quinone oxidoreductase subunit H
MGDRAMMELLFVIAKCAFVFLVVLNLAVFLSWLERKQSALIQDRIGANRASIMGFRFKGLFHILADTLKLFAKEDFIPTGANKFLHTIAPCISMFFALVSFVAIPFGDTLSIGSYTIDLEATNLSIGILLVFGLMSMGIYGVVLAGLSSNNNYTFLASIRAASQMISYEITMGATVIGILMIYGSLYLQDIIRLQGDLIFGWLPKWGIVLQPLGFILFMTAAVAETKRIPFDAPEGESEIIGYNIEYSGIKFTMFMMADFLETVVVAGLLTTLFFGGWQVPYLYSDGFHFPWDSVIELHPLTITLFQISSFLGKLFFFAWLQMMIRWTLPRFRYDQIMRLGWKMLLPLSMLNIFVTALLLL